MKIATWNVNGLRACEKAGFSQWLAAETPDVVCLQEVRSNPDQLPTAVREPGAYRPTWHAAKRKGYSGVATWVGGAELTTAGIGRSDYDDEGRVLITKLPGFTLVNVYVPNGSRDHRRVPFKLDFYQVLHDWIVARHQDGEAVIICGDWNTAHTEIDLANPKSNEMTTGFLPAERIWIDRFLALGLVDVFRARHPGEKGHYTWWSQRFGVRERNIGWRIDYFLVSRRLASNVKDIRHQTEVLGSDHCPLMLTIG